MFRYLAAPREDHSASAMFEGSSSWLRIGKTTLFWEDDSRKHWSSFFGQNQMQSYQNVPITFTYVIQYQAMKAIMGKVHAMIRNWRTHLEGDVFPNNWNSRTAQWVNPPKCSHCELVSWAEVSGSSARLSSHARWKNLYVSIQGSRVDDCVSKILCCKCASSTVTCVG